MSEIIQRKLLELKHRLPRTVELFTGAGGLSLGFHAAGCEILAGVEAEETRAKTHAMNFHPNTRRPHGKGRDIVATDALELLAELGIEPSAASVDFVIGGPPCQAYARVGRAKLAAVSEKEGAYLFDRRGRLWEEYLRFVEDLQPVAVLMENVPDILRYGEQNVADDIAAQLHALGYESRYTLLNAANYGVPQMRERWFLIGIHRSAGIEPSFPEPTHYFRVPPGYRGTRAAARAIQAETVFKSPYFVDLFEPDPTKLLAAVTCEEALSDLPPISVEVKTMGKGRRDLAAKVAYGGPPRSAFQVEMRSWNGFAAAAGVTGHVTRYLPRDFETFARMPEGGEYPDAVAAAEAIVEERTRAMGIQHGSDGWLALYHSIVPPYDRNKFPNKWGKLRRDAPSRTLLAHLSHDSYSHIHYSAEEARTISVREAARLQSFPDGFLFHGAMNAAFGQVGNAVPPLMAKRLATHLICALRAATRDRRTSVAPTSRPPTVVTQTVA